MILKGGGEKEISFTEIERLIGKFILGNSFWGTAKFHVVECLKTNA